MSKFGEIVIGSFTLAVLFSWIPMLMINTVTGALGAYQVSWDECTAVVWAVTLVYAMIDYD